jgi:hypothetical protein
LIFTRSELPPLPQALSTNAKTMIPIDDLAGGVIILTPQGPAGPVARVQEHIR